MEKKDQCQFLQEREILPWNINTDLKKVLYVSGSDLFSLIDFTILHNLMHFVIRVIRIIWGNEREENAIFTRLLLAEISTMLIFGYNLKKN